MLIFEYSIIQTISPHQSRFPDSLRSHSFCRNPSGQRERPWCYSTNPDLEWEFCDVPLCGMYVSNTPWSSWCDSSEWLQACWSQSSQLASRPELGIFSSETCRPISLAKFSHINVTWPPTPPFFYFLFDSHLLKIITAYSSTLTLV